MPHSTNLVRFNISAKEKKYISECPQRPRGTSQTIHTGSESRKLIRVDILIHPPEPNASETARAYGSGPQTLPSATQHTSRQTQHEAKIKKVHLRKSTETKRNQRNRSHSPKIPDPNSGRYLNLLGSPNQLRNRACLKYARFLSSAISGSLRARPLRDPVRPRGVRRTTAPKQLRHRDA